MSPTPETVQALLNSDDFGERLRGVNQIRTLETAIASELLQKAATDQNTRVRYAAISQLANLEGVDGAALLPMLRNTLVNDPEPDVQAAAADALGALKLTEAFEDLKTAYETNPEWLVTFSIVAALGELGDTRGFEILQSALESGNELLVTAAIGSLGELKDDRALPLLLGFVAADDWQIRHRVIQALSQFDTPEAKAAIAQLSQDKSHIVAEAAKQHMNLS
ncbi:MAG: phycobilisome degradation protein NblB [Leptolyngbyaceae cyanobacterium]